MKLSAVVRFGAAVVLALNVVAANISAAQRLPAISATTTSATPAATTAKTTTTTGTSATTTTTATTTATTPSSAMLNDSQNVMPTAGDASWPFWANESQATTSFELGASGNFVGNFYEDYSPCHPDNPNFNCSREAFVTYALGPQRLPLYQVLMVTIIFGGIFITGVLGNVLVCVVIVRHSTMHTATNYYLFSLAVSDLLYLLFGLPAEIFVYWHQYPYLFGLPFCKMRAYISEASTYVSVLTIVAFSMERFLAICHPLHLYAMSGFKRAVRIIAALWIVSFISAVPFGLLSDILYVDYPPDKTRLWESAFCSMRATPTHFPLIELSFCVFFIIPMILIIVLYGRMGAQIRSTTAQQLGVQQGSMHRESRHSQSRKAVIRMLAAVVITFFVCWLPFHIQRLWFMYAKEHEYFQEINEWMFSITGFAYYVSCTINPILYNVMSHRYRVAFKDILCGKRRSVYYNNGFARDQSSFRETTIATSLGGGGGAAGYDRVHSVRVRSILHGNQFGDRESLKSQHPLWTKKTEFTVPLQQDIAEDTGPATPTSSSPPSPLLTPPTASAAAATSLPLQRPLALKLTPPPPPPPTTTTASSVVVMVVDNSLNGRAKVYTENEAQESLIANSDETCI